MLYPLAVMTDIRSLRLEKNHLDFFGVCTMLPPRPIDEGRVMRDRAISGVFESTLINSDREDSLDMSQASQKSFWPGLVGH